MLLSESVAEKLFQPAPTCLDARYIVELIIDPHDIPRDRVVTVVELVDMIMGMRQMTGVLELRDSNLAG